MEVVREYPVLEKGRGRPDYSNDIQEIKRGETPRLMEPHFNEHQKIFAIFFNDVTPLGAGLTEHMIDMETFLPTPYAVPPGYTWELREWMGSVNGSVAIKDSATMDGIPVVDIAIFPEPNSCVHEYEQIIAFGSQFYDPLGEHDWMFDCSVTSLEALEDVKGVGQISLYLIKVGTEDMKEKKVRCKWCSHEFVVPIKQTVIPCPKCGKTFVLPLYGKTLVV